jgi:glutamate/tyrosine decarboxylase-like PLP-dependent enzyme
VPIREDYRADPAAMERAVDARTIMIVGSAPAFPHGVVDPIEEIAGVARRHGLWCHVDACVGGFSLPFVKKLGHAVPAFDFAVPGVTSISADLHKYGFAAKGPRRCSMSTRRISFFRPTTSIAGRAGRYFTHNFSGTRPGGRSRPPGR